MVASTIKNGNDPLRRGNRLRRDFWIGAKLCLADLDKGASHTG